MGDQNDSVYNLVLVARTGELSERERSSLLAELDRLVLSVWELDPYIYRKHPEFLTENDPGLILAYYERELIGFSLYQRVNYSSAAPVTYRFATVVSPAHQGRGLYGQLTDKAISFELKNRATGPLYCAWRTRNPKVWASLSRRCVRICPPLTHGEYDDELASIAVKTASMLYPDLELITPSMHMPNAYHFLKYRHPQPYHDRLLEKLFSDLPDHSAVWTLGELRRDAN